MIQLSFFILGFSCNICDFPFTYGEVTYDSCLYGDAGYWCPTDKETVDSNGNYQNWTWCDTNGLDSCTEGYNFPT
jgi:hypothetical protein